MKRSILISLAWIFSIAGFSQSPLLFNYSAAVKDVMGNILPNQQVNFKISIIEGSIAGPAVYEETHLVTTDALGLAAFLIGAGTVELGSIATVDWHTSSFYLKAELDISGGTNYVNMGTTQMLSVPYALYATQAGQGGGSPWLYSGDDIVNANTRNVAVGTTFANARLTVKGHYSAPVTDPLFEVKNSDGATIFAIYTDSVRVNIIDDAPGNTGSFAVKSRNLLTGITEDLLFVSPDSTRLYGNSTSKMVGINRSVSNYPLHVGSDISNGNSAFLTEGGVWTSSSSKEFKDRFTSLPENDILNKIADMQIQGWYYKGSTEFHIGPVAEDFFDAFGCGATNIVEDKGRYLSASDMAGITLMTLKNLNEEWNEVKQIKKQLSEESNMLQFELAELEKRIRHLESR